jgi:hypothetical protein
MSVDDANLNFYTYTIQEPSAVSLAEHSDAELHRFEHSSEKATTGLGAA